MFYPPPIFLDTLSLLSLCKNIVLTKYFVFCIYFEIFEKVFLSIIPIAAVVRSGQWQRGKWSDVLSGCHPSLQQSYCCPKYQNTQNAKRALYFVLLSFCLPFSATKLLPKIPKNTQIPCNKAAQNIEIPKEFQILNFRIFISVQKAWLKSALFGSWTKSNILQEEKVSTLHVWGPNGWRIVSWAIVFCNWAVIDLDRLQSQIPNSEDELVAFRLSTTIHH